MFNRWTQYDLGIIFLQTFCENFDFSIHKLNFLFSDQILFYRKFSPKFPEIFLKIFRKIPDPTLYPVSTPLYYTLTPNPQHPEHT